MSKHENIPSELRERRQWVAAKVYRDPTKPGKTKKILIDPATGAAAESDNPSTWGTFYQAVALMKRERLQGIAFAFTADDEYCGCDFDDVLDESGELEQWVCDYLSRLNSYAEYSQSGRGVHVIVKGKLPPGGRVNHEKHTEMYESGRFFVCTGSVIGTYTEIRDAQDAVNLIHEWTFGAEQPKPEPVHRPAHPVTLADSDLIAKAMAAHNGTKFRSLWNGSTTGYQSQSEADFALCSLLGWWAGGVADRVDRLFRQSGLMRDKWDERHYSDGGTYGAVTIANAIGRLDSFFHGNGARPPDVTLSAMPEIEAPREPLGWQSDDGFELPDVPRVARHTSEAATMPTVADVAENPATWADMARMIGPVRWDWPGWLPSSLMSMLVGNSGDGKSIAAMYITGTYLRGWPWPDGTAYTGETGKVLWVEAEAAQAVNLERATSWGLPVENILSPFVNPLDDANLFDATHLAAIRKVAARDDVRLVVVDSLSGACGGREKADDMMPVVKWLAELARNLDKPVLLLHHLRKRGIFDSGEAVSLDRVRGSTVITQPARVVWALDVPDPNDADHRRLSVIKSNLGRFPDALGLRITDTGLTFDAPPQPPRTETQVDKAIDLLKSLLATGPRLSAELEAEARGAGISWDTMKRAKDKLGIVARKDGKGGWSWALPYRRQEDDS